MKIYVSIDDTDSLEAGSTGRVAEEIKDRIRKKGLGSGSFVTRHQLYLHPDVPYTSHNSSMCFIVDTEEEAYEEIIDISIETLLEISEPEADPGLAVAKKDKIEDIEALISFGKRTKREVMTKEEAYELASTLGIHLSEHGGTGDGIIGALAGIGLRLTEKDGRIRGREKFPNVNGYTTVGDILRDSDISIVRGFGGEDLEENSKVKLGECIKALYLYGKKGLILKPFYDESLDEDIWRTLEKEEWQKIKN